MQQSNNKILVTGGGSGIGLGLTERFVQAGNTVLICGRREENLKAVQDRLPGVHYKVCDLAGENGRNELYQWVAAQHPDTNVLVNNAGIQNWMQVTDGDFYPRAVDEINTNILAPLHLTSLFLQLPALRTLINVTSGLAFVPLAKVPVYSATKAFFRSFTLSLRHQLQSRGIEVIEMIPPALNTDLGGKGLHDGHPAVSDFVEAVFAQMQKGSHEWSFGFSEDRVKASNESMGEAFKRMNP